MATSWSGLRNDVLPNAGYANNVDTASKKVPSGVVSTAPATVQNVVHGTKCMDLNF